MDLEPERARAQHGPLDGRRRRRASMRRAAPAGRARLGRARLARAVRRLRRARARHSSCACAARRSPGRRRALCACARRCGRWHGARCFRWLVLLELSDLLLDVFVGFLALYLVDEAGASPATGGLAVARLERRRARRVGGDDPAAAQVDGLRYLRASAAATGAALRRASCSCRATAAKLVLAGGDRRRERGLVPGAAGAAVRRARRSERPRADRRRALPAQRGAAARDRRRSRSGGASTSRCGRSSPRRSRCSCSSPRSDVAGRDRV